MEMDAMIDKLKSLKGNFKTILIVILLISGIIAGVILVQNPQIFRPKASEEIYNAIEVKDEEGNSLCSENECEIQDPNSPIKFNINVGRLEEQANKE